MNETTIINTGFTFAWAGDAKQDDIGLALSLAMAFYAATNSARSPRGAKRAPIPGWCWGFFVAVTFLLLGNELRLAATIVDDQRSWWHLRSCRNLEIRFEAILDDGAITDNDLFPEDDLTRTMIT